MSMKWHFLLIIGFVGFSCTKPTPQIPSNKGINTDTVSTGLIQLNKNLAKSEDSILNVLVNAKYPDFKKSKLGFWYKIEHKTSGKLIREKEICSVKYSLSTLNGNLLLNDNTNITIGKKEIISGIEEGLKLMNKGDNATIIIPWYLAYGLEGNKSEIKPYTSLIANISVSTE